VTDAVKLGDRFSQIRWPMAVPDGSFNTCGSVSSQTGSTLWFGSVGFSRQWTR